MSNLQLFLFAVFCLASVAGIVWILSSPEPGDDDDSWIW